MKRILALLAACALLLTACAPKTDPGATSPSPTPSPSATPTASPSPTPEDPDGDPYDESDYYFDFGQDDLISLNYDVSWPEDQMAGWTQQPNTRVSALLTLQNGQDTLTVLLEDAPEHAGLDSFLETARELMTYTYEGVELQETETVGDYRRIRGTLPDGSLLECYYGQVNGLYMTAELRATADTAQDAQALFEETFMPNLNFTYTEIEALGGSEGEE